MLRKQSLNKKTQLQDSWKKNWTETKIGIQPGHNKIHDSVELNSPSSDLSNE